jgi:hypothetical protein
MVKHGQSRLVRASEAAARSIANKEVAAALESVMWPLLGSNRLTSLCPERLGLSESGVADTLIDKTT